MKKVKKLRKLRKKIAIYQKTSNDYFNLARLTVRAFYKCKLTRFFQNKDKKNVCRVI